MKIAVIFSLLQIQTLVAFTPSSPGTTKQTSLLSEQIDDRRTFFTSIIQNSAIATSIPWIMIPSSSNAAEEGKFIPFQDTNVGFQIQVPSNWKKSEQTLPDRRRLVLFVNDKGDDSGSEKGTEDLIFVAYTTVRDDFTSLASFGSVDQVCDVICCDDLMFFPF